MHIGHKLDIVSYPPPRKDHISSGKKGTGTSSLKVPYSTGIMLVPCNKTCKTSKYLKPK